MENQDLQYLEIEGTRYKTMLTKKFQSRKAWIPANPYNIVSYIPGTVREIFVEVGQEVGPGDDIMVLQAMKMRNLVKSEVYGTIRKINIQSNETIPKGFLMIVIEPDEDDENIENIDIQSLEDLNPLIE